MRGYQPATCIGMAAFTADLSNLPAVPLQFGPAIIFSGECSTSGGSTHSSSKAHETDAPHDLDGKSVASVRASASSQQLTKSRLSLLFIMNGGTRRSGKAGGALLGSSLAPHLIGMDKFAASGLQPLMVVMACSVSNKSRGSF